MGSKFKQNMKNHMVRKIDTSWAFSKPTTGTSISPDSTRLSYLDNYADTFVIGFEYRIIDILSDRTVTIKGYNTSNITH